MKFVIFGKLPGLNQLFGAANRCRWVGADMKKKQTQLCAGFIHAARLRRVKRPVTIHFTWIEPDLRRDVDNVSTGQKFVLDALVECGVLPNDGRAWVRGISHSFPPPDKKNPRIEVEIEELEPVAVDSLSTEEKKKCSSNVS